jgi:DTW domain-containing protein YfiP
MGQAEPLCPRCFKPLSLNFCDDITPVENRVAVLILQHPQEQDKDLGTARLTALSLTNATIRIGLSWPSLAKALGKQADPRAWAALYLGSTRASDFPPGAEIAAFDKKGRAFADQAAALAGIEGVIALDGTWSQAKTLWWRNAWLLKARRIALRPRRSSLYGKLRREPRREGLSTIESAGFLLSRLEGRPEIEERLNGTLARLLDKYRARRS